MPLPAATKHSVPPDAITGIEPSAQSSNLSVPPSGLPTRQLLHPPPLPAMQLPAASVGGQISLGGAALLAVLLCVITCLCMRARMMACESTLRTSSTARVPGIKIYRLQRVRKRGQMALKLKDDAPTSDASCWSEEASTERIPSTTSTERTPTTQKCAPDMHLIEMASKPLASPDLRRS